MPKNEEGEKLMIEQALSIEVNVPVTMRDGTVLRADVYRPDTAEKYPTLLVRIPYDKSNPRYCPMLDPIRMAKNGYVVVQQDCRGVGASAGELTPFINEPKDGYDTVEWAAVQPWSNGKVGMYGVSYLGLTQWAAAKEQPPHLMAIFPGMIGPNPRDFLFTTGGAFQLHAAQLWALHMSALVLANKPPEPSQRMKIADLIMNGWDNLKEEAKLLPLKKWPLIKETGLADFYFDWLEHPDNDEYWKEREHALYEKTTVPAYFVTSWYDINLSTLSNYKGMKERGGSEQARKGSKLLVGPWIHEAILLQQVGDIDFGIRSLYATIDLVGIHLRWFDYWLKGVNNGIMDEPPVRIFVMGDNTWRSENEWPLARTQYTKFYLNSGGQANSLKGNGVLNTEPPTNEKTDTFKYDPRDPVPTKGGSILTLTRLAGAMDQREVEERQDVLVYTTSPLEQDIEVTGPIVVVLFAASSAKDTDFTAKLVDVWPDGKAYILTDGIVRARYRDSDLKQSLIEPGKVYQYTIDLFATSNVFKVGHRIRVDISSSNFPRYDRNPNTGHPIGQDAELEIAVQTIFHDKERPSHIVLPIIPR